VTDNGVIPPYLEVSFRLRLPGPTSQHVRKARSPLTGRDRAETSLPEMRLKVFTALHSYSPRPMNTLLFGAWIFLTPVLAYGCLQVSRASLPENSPQPTGITRVVGEGSITGDASISLLYKQNARLKKIPCLPPPPGFLLSLIYLLLLARQMLFPILLDKAGVIGFSRVHPNTLHSLAQELLPLTRLQTPLNGIHCDNGVQVDSSSLLDRRSSISLAVLQEVSDFYPIIEPRSMWGVLNRCLGVLVLKTEGLVRSFRGIPETPLCISCA